jgi:hypothetical protein
VLAEGPDLLPRLHLRWVVKLPVQRLDRGLVERGLEKVGLTQLAVIFEGLEEALFLHVAR